MKKYVQTLLVLSSSLIVSACASNNLSTTAQSDDPGFLDNYSILQPVAAESGIKAWRYVNPQFGNHEYNAVQIKPAVIYNDPTSAIITSNVLDETKNGIVRITTSDLVQRKFALASKAGEHVVYVDMIVTGALVNPNTWSLRRLIPAPTAIAMASGEITRIPGDDSLIVLEIGGKALDTNSGLLVGASFVSVPASKFVGKVSTAKDFESALTPWIKLSIANLANNK
jgi:hypothetical protein